MNSDLQAVIIMLPFVMFGSGVLIGAVLEHKADERDPETWWHRVYGTAMICIIVTTVASAAILIIALISGFVTGVSS